MRINFNNVELYNRSLNYNGYNNSPNTIKHNTNYLSLPRDMVSFQKSSDVPTSVAKYLKQRRKTLEEQGKLWDRFYYYDPLKLEGIQNGIEIFEDLTFPQIAYLITKMRGVLVQRGCSNSCIYCNVEAQSPEYMKTMNFTNKIDYEDYENLLNGFKELNKRLDFNPFNNDIHLEAYHLFHDADCSTISLQDKNGKTYDYVDLAKMLHDVTKKSVIFDTTGWDIKDTKTQKRMEDLVQKIVNSDEYNFMRFNISINPFHSIHNQAVEFKQKGDNKNYEKYRDIYTTRIANAIFTFSPLIDKKNPFNYDPMLTFIIRGLNDDYRYPELFDYSDYTSFYLCNETLKKLEKLYAKDLASDCPKVIKNEEQKKRYLDYLENYFLHNRDTDIRVTNKRLRSKFSEAALDRHSRETADGLHNNVEKGIKFYNGIIDLNGKLYMTNYIESYPTDIVLNYNNKGKPTAHMAPNLRRDKVITKDLIKNYYKTTAKKDD